MSEGKLVKGVVREHVPGEVVVAEVLPADVALGGGPPPLMHLSVYAQVAFRHALAAEGTLHFLTWLCWSLLLKAFGFGITVWELRVIGVSVTGCLGNPSF